MHESDQDSSGTVAMAAAHHVHGMCPMSTIQHFLFLSDPRSSAQWTELPGAGIGLLRLDEVLCQDVGIHPLALLRPHALTDSRVAAAIAERSGAYRDPATYFVATIAQRLTQIAHEYHPRPVRVRFTDLNSAQYARLLGGAEFEPTEERPEIGLRGAARYISELYRPAFELECRAIRRARERNQADNIEAIIPFCRTLQEADAVIDAMAASGLHRGKRGFSIHVMAELPGNAVVIPELAQRFDGLSIGTGDLSSLVMATDPAATAMPSTDWSNPALRRIIAQIIEGANTAGVPTTLCGAGAERPELVQFAATRGVSAVATRPECFERIANVLAA